MRILVEHGAVSANVSGLEVLLFANGGDTTGRKTGSARADQLGSAPDQLQLGRVGAKVKLVKEEVECLLEVLERVTG